MNYERKKMINLEALKEAQSKAYIGLKQDGDVKLWLVTHDNKQYYIITIEVDNSTRIKIIEPRKAKALRIYKRAVRKRRKV